MVRQTYVGLGKVEWAVKEFDAFLPYVRIIRAMQAKCAPMSPDDNALKIAVDGLETAAYHFTRRPMYFDMYPPERDWRRNYYPGLGEDRKERIAAFEALRPYHDGIFRLRLLCKPFGRDYLALNIASDCLDTAAYHFTKRDHFYGPRGDSAGPIRPPDW